MMLLALANTLSLLPGSRVHCTTQARRVVDPAGRSRAAPSAAAPQTLEPRPVTVDLGKGKSVSIMLPRHEDEPDEAELAQLSTDELLKTYGHLLGAGDVVWPAGMALSRLLAHCPSFVAGMRCLELGSGLGAVGLVAARAGATSVVLTDYDADVLELAALGAAENGVESVVSTRTLDWTVQQAPSGG